jgi:fatty-acyl-CoA synthase
MSNSSRQVAPTLVDAVRALAQDDVRGYVFVRPDGNERLWTFKALASEAERRGAALRALGLAKGDRLAMVLPDGEEFVLSFLAALFAGVVPVPIYPQLSFKNVESYHGTVAHIAGASGASLLLTNASSRPFLEPVAPRVPSLRAIVSVDELVGTDSKVDAAVEPSDVAFLQFTSGSTSRPKGVVVTHGNLSANAEAFMIDGVHRDPSFDKGVSWLPLFHDMGLIGFVVGPLFTNVPCVFLPTASFVRTPRLWIDKIHEHRATITYAPNFAYALVAKRLKDKDVEGLDLSCLRVAGCGAEPIQAKALRDFATRLHPARFDPRAFVPSYGMAEATLAISFSPLGRGLRTDTVDPQALTQGEARSPSPASSDGSDLATPPVRGIEIVDCGRPFAGHEIVIVDDAGERLADRRVGQIVVRGPSVTPGYFQDPELTAKTYKALPGDSPGDAPWLHTGDLGYFAEGGLFVCGRVKDMIIVRGRNYYPSDIEWSVSELPHVRRGNVVAFGVFVDAQGQIAPAGLGEEQLVLCCEGSAQEADAIRDAASACIAAQFGLTPHDVVVLPLSSLPRTSSGKPQRRRVRQMYMEGTLPRARTLPGTSPDGHEDTGTSA